MKGFQKKKFVIREVEINEVKQCTLQIKKKNFNYIGTTLSTYELLKKQILIKKSNKFKNVDPDVLLN